MKYLLLVLAVVMSWGSSQGVDQRPAPMPIQKTDLSEAQKTEEMIADIQSKLGCDSEVMRNPKSQAEVTAAYRTLLAQGREQGFTPLLLLPTPDIAEVLSHAFDERSTEEILRLAEGIDAEALLAQRKREVMPAPEEDFGVIGAYVKSEPSHQLSALTDYKGELCEAVIIAKIPTDKPWELAAWVPMGGFNDCPAPEEQVAVFRYWHERYGATPALVTVDIWQMDVARPPRTQAESETLAMEQFAFCGDIVWQGAGSAGALTDATTWFFWWD